jgi:hypothetical protein
LKHIVNQRRRNRQGQGGMVYGPELITNGTFDTVTTGWTASTSTLGIVSGKMRVTGTSSGAGRADQSITCVSGAWYEINFDVSGTSTGKALRVGTSAGGTQILNTGALSTATGYIYRFQATQTTIHIGLIDGDATGSNYSEWDNVSVRLMTNVV